MHEYFSGEFENCRAGSLDGLKKLVEERELVILTSAAIGEYVDFRWLGYGEHSVGDIASFFRGHVGHRLAPMSEYGDFDDDCPEYLANKPGPGYSDKCRLTEGHLGPCVSREVKR